MFIRADHAEQLPKGCCMVVPAVSETASSTYVNRCETPAASSFVTRAPNESCKRSSHIVRMEAVGAIDGVTEGVTVGFGTGDLVGLPGIGVGAAVGGAVGTVVGEAVGGGVGVAVGETEGLKVGFVEGRAVGRAVGGAVGTELGSAVGGDDGTAVGVALGSSDGCLLCGNAVVVIVIR